MEAAEKVPDPPAGGARWMWWVLSLGFAIALGACGSGGEDPAETSEPQARVPGFAEVAFEVRPAGAPATEQPTEYCALLADSEERWEQGLSERRDLAGYEGMVFRFDRDVTGAFHMRDTPIPLSVAWFDANGAFIGSADMEPCLGRPDCSVYRAPRPYRYALEVPRGVLPRLKIGPGAVVDFGGTCPATT